MRTRFPEVSITIPWKSEIFSRKYKGNDKSLQLVELLKRDESFVVALVRNPTNG
jgi:hypothetical protein